MLIGNFISSTFGNKRLRSKRPDLLTSSFNASELPSQSHESRTCDSTKACRKPTAFIRRIVRRPIAAPKINSLSVRNEWKALYSWPLSVVISLHGNDLASLVCDRTICTRSKHRDVSLITNAKPLGGCHGLMVDVRIHTTPWAALLNLLSKTAWPEQIERCCGNQPMHQKEVACLQDLPCGCAVTIPKEPHFKTRLAQLFLTCCKWLAVNLSA